MSNQKTKRISLCTLVLLVYIALPLLILFKVLSFEHKFSFLTIGAVLVYILLRFLGFKNADIGISSLKIKESLLAVLPITLVLLIAAIVLFVTGAGQRFEPSETIYFYLFYLFISSPIQEFLYRGALTGIFNQLGLSENVKLFLTSILYSLVHIIYKDVLTLLLTFIIGLIWYKCYRKTNNLIGVSASHAVLGIVTIVTGVID